MSWPTTYSFTGPSVVREWVEGRVRPPVAGILEKQLKQIPLRVAAADGDDGVANVPEQPCRGRVIPHPVGDQGLRNGCPDIGEDAARRRHFLDHPFGFINLPGGRQGGDDMAIDKRQDAVFGAWPGPFRQHPPAVAGIDAEEREAEQQGHVVAQV